MVITLKVNSQKLARLKTGFLILWSLFTVVELVCLAQYERFSHREIFYFDVIGLNNSLI